MTRRKHFWLSLICVTLHSGLKQWTCAGLANVPLGSTLSHLIKVCEAASALIIAMIRADSRHNLSGIPSPKFVRTGCGGRGTAPEPAVSWTVRRCRRPRMPVDCRHCCLASSCDTSAHSVCIAAKGGPLGKDVIMLSSAFDWTTLSSAVNNKHVWLQSLQPAMWALQGMVDTYTFRALMSTLSAICLFLR